MRDSYNCFWLRKCCSMLRILWSSICIKTVWGFAYLILLYIKRSILVLIILFLFFLKKLFILIKCALKIVLLLIFYYFLHLKSIRIYFLIRYCNNITSRYFFQFFIKCFRLVFIFQLIFLILQLFYNIIISPNIRCLF